MKRKLLFTLACCALSGLFILPVSGQDKDGDTPVMNKPEVQMGKHDVSRPLRDIAPLEARGKRNGKEPLPFLGKGVGQGGDDGAVQAALGLAPAPLVAVTSGLNFDGVGQAFTGPQGNFTVQSAPPDTTGAVGATQFVQWVNTSFAIFDKATGSVQYGPAAGNTLWAGFGGPCQTENDGDPIVQYDKAANRWMLSQFAVPGGAAGFWQCVAVSQTSDATGAYNRYAFQYTNFNDYPKVGVWPDGYYVTYNMFSGNSFAGGRACALDRAKMLAGLPATQICFQLSTSFGGLQPGDLDGATAPPAGAPNPVISFGTNILRYWKFHVDWTTPANSTFTGPTNLAVSAFTAPGTIVTQASSTQTLDTLGDRLMFRAAYRNFGTHESLLASHAVRLGNGGSRRTGVRWYELRNLSGTPTVFQQSTYSPDNVYRWMSSIASDKQGNIAVGFNASSRNLGVNPGVRFAARAASDPLNTLGSETIIRNGTGAQNGGLSRWGDYSHLSVDPADDCTFWYTTEYMNATGSFNWRTRINSFKLGTCQ